MAQGGAKQMVVPSYPPGSMPPQYVTAATATVGGRAPHHMVTVSPQLMGGAPRGLIQPQKYPKPLYRTAAMGHHPQQMDYFCFRVAASLSFFRPISLERILVSSSSVSATEVSGCVSRGSKLLRPWGISETVLVHGCLTLRRRFDPSSLASVKVWIARPQTT